MSNIAATVGIPSAVLAHQGGWDEVLLVAGPMVLIAGLLWLAKRRVRAAQPAPPAQSAQSARSAQPAPPARSSATSKPSARGRPGRT